MSKFLSLVLPSRAEILPVVTNSKPLVWLDFSAVVPDVDESCFRRGAFNSSYHAGFLAISSIADFSVLVGAVKQFLESHPEAKLYKSILELEQNFAWFAVHIYGQKADAELLSPGLHHCLKVLKPSNGVFWHRVTKGESLDDDTLEAVQP
jgi:hypothetical protein